MIEILGAPLLRDASPLQIFLTNIGNLVAAIFQYFIPRVLTLVQSEPMLLLSVAVIGVLGAIGIFGRLLSRD